MAIQSQSLYAEGHYTLSIVLKQEGKLPEVATSLREAIRLQPTLPELIALWPASRALCGITPYYRKQ